MFYHQFIKQKKPSRTLLQQLYTHYNRYITRCSRKFQEGMIMSKVSQLSFLEIQKIDELIA